MRRVLIGGAVCLAAACGGSSPSAPSTPPPPPPPTFVTQQVTGSLGAQFGNWHPLTIERSGNLTLELSWPGAADLDIYLTDAGCTDIFQQRTCERFGTADSISQNPERITRTVTGGSRFNIWVVNASRATSANYTLTMRVDYAVVEASLAREETATLAFGGTAYGKLK